MPNASHRSASRGSPASFLAPGTGLVLGILLTLVPAILFAWWQPARNVWPALALVLAFGLDAAGRIAGRAARRQTGHAAEFRGLPSPMLALGNAVWVGGAVMSAVSLLRPDLFAPLASALAGLVAMGAFARLALARTVVVIDAAERAESEAKAGGRTSAKASATGTTGEGTGR